MQQVGRFIGIVLAVAGLQFGQAELDNVPVSDVPVMSEALSVISFETKYGLDVVEVLDVPTSLVGEVSPQAQAPVVEVVRQCPFQVRAVVEGEQDVGSFATVVANEESMIVKPGTKYTFGGQRWRIQAIDNDDVVIERGGRTLRCPLGQ
jgi:hypothetical protein